MLPPGEAVCRDWSEELETYAKDDNDWTESFLEHPVTLEVGDPSKVCPYSLYVDAAPFSKPESFWGLWAEDTRSGKIYLVAVCLKSDMCQCGCRGYCSVNAFQTWLIHHCCWWAKGMWPPTRHDGLAWRPEDTNRAKMAGTKMSCHGACTELRADWPEFCFSCGFRGHRSTDAPCFKCFATAENLHDYESCTVDSLPWQPVTMESYMEEVQRCEVHVDIPSSGVRDEIARVLFSDRTKNGAKGRIMSKNYAGPGIHLKARDRLETNTQLLDTFAFEDLKAFPVCVTFWRTTEQFRLNRRCKLYDIPGLTHARLCICVLHCLDLGVVSKYVAAAIWYLLLANIYKLNVSNQEELIAIGLVRLRTELWEFYRTQGTKKNSTLHDLTVGMLGDKTTPAMHHCSGAATRSLLPFVVHMFRKFETALPTNATPFWIASGEALSNYFTLQAAHERKVPDISVKLMMECALRHNTLIKRCFPDFLTSVHTPKHHQWLHAIEDAHFQGNPSKHSTYRNESLNGTLARISRSVHRSTYAISVHEKFDVLCKYAPHKMGGSCN